MTQDDEPEDEPDKDVLEDGQDQSPEEMERLKKLRREQEVADKVRLAVTWPASAPQRCAKVL